MKLCVRSLIFVFLWCGAACAAPAVTLSPLDYFEIYQLYATYSVGIDINDAALRTSVFAPDGTMSSELVSKHVPYGMAQMRKNMGTVTRGPRPLGGHVQTEIHLTPTAQGVDATAYVMLVPRKPDADGNFIGQPGFYTDRLVKTPAGWRFKTREIFEGREFAKPYDAARTMKMVRDVTVDPPGPVPSGSGLTSADFVAINQLYAAWSVALDSGNGAGYAATYAPGGTFAGGGAKPQPATAMARQVDAMGRRKIPSGVYHIMMTLHVTPSAAGADATAYGMIYDGRRDARGRLVGDKAFYRDALVRTAAGWRFQSRRQYLAREMAAKGGKP